MNTKRVRTVDRKTMLAMLFGALQCGELRFARNAALAWLAAFPGDLEVRLLQSRILYEEGQSAQAVQGMELILRKDPQFMVVYPLLARICKMSDPARYQQAVTHYHVLGGETANAEVLPWGDPLRAAYQVVEKGQWAEAGRLIPSMLRKAGESHLAAVVHLRWSQAVQEPDAVIQLAQLYKNRWGDSLAINLILAWALLRAGNEQEGVRLMYQCAANDAAGQVAERLWGKKHPYRSLWPEDLVIPFDQPIPAGVSSYLGWNQLTGGANAPAPVSLEPQPPAFVDPAPFVEEPAAAPAEPDPKGMVLDGADGWQAARKEDPIDADEDFDRLFLASLNLSYNPLANEAKPQAAQPGKPAVKPSGKSADAPVVEAALPVPPVFERDVIEPEETPAQPEAAAPEQDFALLDAVESAPVVEEEKAPANPVKAVEAEFAKLAKQLKRPDLAREDGRFPAYILLSARSGLVKEYGATTAGMVDQELHRLAGLIGQRTGWETFIFYPDDAACAEKWGLTQVDASDPWKIKHALADLDQALAKKGLMIGCVMIIGGDRVVPFHRLPNPTEDFDRDVPSDSPYATLDSNYFIPEWPVGRVPGEPGPDAGFLLDQLRRMQKYHAKMVSEGKKPGGWFARLLGLFNARREDHKTSSLGYTAEIWRRSSMAVFRPIGAPHTLLSSPPETSGSINPERIVSAGVGYYNLHGTEDSSAWYGQRDPTDSSNAPDYPVALSPGDLRKNGKAPRVVFSEACYGAQVFGKSESDSMALKFLGIGAQAVVASTCIAYGSVTTPLISADLLGSLFWKHLKSGRTAADALFQARIDLAREMDNRQGYLDGEDQKALISFVLLGDPLAVYDGVLSQGKANRRMKDHPTVKTVTEVDIPVPPGASADMIKRAKSLAEEYLPGADLAYNVHLSRQESDGAAVQTVTRRGRKGARPGEDGRMVVTVSKEVRFAKNVHHHYLRVTVDGTGKPVKVAVSR